MITGRIVTRATEQRVIAAKPDEQVITGTSGKNVSFVIPGQDVISGTADDIFNVEQGVILTPARGRTAFKADLHISGFVTVIGGIIARTTIQRIVPDTTIKQVIPGTAKQNIVPGQAIQRIVAIQPR